MIANAPSSHAQLVVFWASWCPPCRTETPALRALAHRPPEGLTVVVFGHDEDAAAMRRFLGGEPPTAWNLRMDDDRSAARTWGVSELPSSVLVVDGTLRARFNGARNWDGRPMRRLLERLVSEGPR
jgi:thioredoxin-like negative regulator of GroEL